MTPDNRDILIRLQDARERMAKLTSSRKPVMVSIPPENTDADMLICSACEDAIVEIARLRKVIELVSAIAKERDENIGDEHCSFCGSAYDLNGMTDVGYCWVCGTAKLEEIIDAVAALAPPESTP